MSLIVLISLGKSSKLFTKSSTSNCFLRSDNTTIFSIANSLRKQAIYSIGRSSKAIAIAVAIAVAVALFVSVPDCTVFDQ